MKFLVRKSMYVRFVKPLIDYVIAIVLMILATPFFLLVAILLFIANQGKVFFCQERVGYKERIFMAFKFRTMNDNRDVAGNLLPDEIRLTAVGKFIRKTSLDELPQIINVLKGDMSFIGPRPLLPEYLPYYSDVQSQRHSVKPGITGLAQINGRNETTWEKRFEWDVAYVTKMSFGLDARIFFMTIFKVLGSEGISAQGHATMPKFSDFMKAKTIVK